MKISESLLSQLARWKVSPLAFVQEALGAEPEEWQRAGLELIGTGDRVAVRSGHGVGKTTWLVWLILWFLLTRYPCKVVVTGNSQDQLADVVWSAVNQWIARLPGAFRNELEITATRVMLKASPRTSFAVARTASRDNPEALQGFHDENLLFVVEEASGIPEIVFEVGQGSLSTLGAKMVLAGNPTRGSGFFFDAFHRNRANWQLLHVNSEDVPRARGHIKDIADNYGADSNQYRVRVLGEFPIADDDVLIPLHLIEAAVNRKQADEVAAIQTYRVVWGVDVARFGDDRSALCKRRANEILAPVKSWRNKDTMQSAGIVKLEYDKTEDDLKPHEILVDVIGLGAGVVDRLKELGLPVRGISVSETKGVDEQYLRLRDELAFRCRKWFSEGAALMPDDPPLIAELSNIHYDISSSGKLFMESKKVMKELNPRMGSPDLADSLFLTFAGGVSRIKEHSRDKYSRMPRVKAAVWAG